MNKKRSRCEAREEYAIHIYLHVPERNFYCLAADVGGEKFIKGSIAVQQTNLPDLDNSLQFTCITYLVPRLQ